MNDKLERHRQFWEGRGPSLLLTTPDGGPLYDTADYRRRFDEPQAMWDAEMRRAELLLDWPTDGVPTVRPNLGVVFVPAIAGQAYQIADGQMPWPGRPLSREALRASRSVDVASAELMRRAETFYDIHRRHGTAAIAAYHPDTQGVFDIAHLLYGDDLLAAMAGDEAEQADVCETLETCLDLYLRITWRIKALLNEPAERMLHGHGTPQGIYFPQGGTRVSEDTATLLSPAMLDRFVMPYIERAMAPFAGGFMHFCGLHKAFFERLCQTKLVRAIDLGNPEKYDTGWLLARCAESGTVLYSRLPALEGESGVDYVVRIGRLVRQAGARVALRCTVTPRDRDEARQMLDLWRELTQP